MLSRLFLKYIFLTRIQQFIQIRFIGRAIDQQTLILIQSEIHIISRNQSPSLSCQKKTVITEMVIRITNANIECNSAIQFLQIILHVSIILKYEIDNIQIDMTDISIVTIIQAQKSHG